MVDAHLSSCDERERERNGEEEREGGRECVREGQTERAEQDWTRGQETQEASLGGHELAEGWRGAEEHKGSWLG